MISQLSSDENVCLSQHLLHSKLFIKKCYIIKIDILYVKIIYDILKIQFNENFGARFELVALKHIFFLTLKVIQNLSTNVMKAQRNSYII